MICTLNFGHKHARKVLCVHSNLAVYTRSREVCCIHSKRTINSQSRDWWANLFKHPTSKVLKLHSLEINSQPRKVLYNVLRFSQKHKGYQACSTQTLSSCLSQYYSFFYLAFPAVQYNMYYGFANGQRNSRLSDVISWF